MSAYSPSLHGWPAAGACATERLLVSGGGARLALDPLTGCNRYGCPPRPDPALLDFASSTASVISEPAYRAAEALRHRLEGGSGRNAALARVREEERIRGELLALLGLDGMEGLEAELAPSGTDLHVLARCRAAADGRGLTVLMPEPAETGSGVPAALGDALLRLAHPGRPGQDVALRTVAVRNADGRPRAAAEIDDEFACAADAALAAGRTLLLVLLDVSKTGLTAPSPCFALAQFARQRQRVHLLVDACQARLAPATIRAWLEAGAMVALTGSKFLGGPSFSGVLLSRGGAGAARRAAGGSPMGLLLRWEAALTELRAFAALGDHEVASCLVDFRAGLEERIRGQARLALLPGQATSHALPGIPPSWDSHATIFSLRLAAPGGRWLTPEEVKRVQMLLGQDLAPWADGSARQMALAGRRIHLGQAVACGNPDGTPGAVLRLCLSACQVVRAAQAGGVAALLDDAGTALGKLAWTLTLAAGPSPHRS